MPITKSAIKRVRQQKKRQARNILVKKAVRTKIKVLVKNIETKKIAEAKRALIEAISEIDRAVKKGVLHKNTAARRKSQLSKTYNTISPKAYGTEKSEKKPAVKPKTTAKKLKALSKPKAPAKKKTTSKTRI